MDGWASAVVVGGFGANLRRQLVTQGGRRSSASRRWWWWQFLFSAFWFFWQIFTTCFLPHIWIFFQFFHSLRTIVNIMNNIKTFSHVHCSVGPPIVNIFSNKCIMCAKYHRKVLDCLVDPTMWGRLHRKISCCWQFGSNICAKLWGHLWNCQQGS